ncbi:DMT family transporter [Ructibacterium gallinarum]|uniref:DMT family transporter n=1 Tax=Ructibacterium gallinarum TaxID=2779355 RepID=A0A9D5R8P4_9FIRM|nr:DMT family transporter [Ructibacterium gallinarum]MBE5040182.1 DMT family transporter [Ructibacterium gallinarum]
MKELAELAQKRRGVFAILCAAFFFALMTAFVRLSGDLPSVQKSFFRNLVALLFASGVLLKTPEKFHFEKSNLLPLLLRSAFGTLGILGNFYAADHLLLSDASMLNKLSPFFAILCSFFLLKEKIKPVQGLAVLLAFAGSLFIIKPTGQNLLSPGAVAGVLGGFGAGVAYTYVRVLSGRGERKPFIVFFFSAFSCLCTLPFLIFDYHPMSFTQLVFLLLAGLSAAGGQFSITAAYSYAPAREISVFDYSQVIFAAVLGFFLFDQIPDLYSLLGYVIICAVSVGMFFYNRAHASAE